MLLLPKKGKIIPIMGNTLDKKSLCDVLFGKTRQGVLALIFGHADRSFYTSQILDTVKTGRGTVQRELKNLTEAGIIIREVEGRQVYYRANHQCPIFNELKSIIAKTFGIADVIRSFLLTVQDNISIAFIFGSIASGSEARTSDIDIVVVGDISFGQVTSLVSGAEQKLGREINPVVYTVTEFRQKVKEEHHFVKSVVGGEKIFLIGGEDELARMVE